MAILRGQYTLIYLLKGVNQGVPPPEKWFFENPVHVFEDRDLQFFTKVLIFVQLEDNKLTQRVRPPERP